MVKEDQAHVDALTASLKQPNGTVADSDSVYTNITVPDRADCNAHGIDYQPCVLPGDVSGRQREIGRAHV